MKVRRLISSISVTFILAGCAAKVTLPPVGVVAHDDNTTTNIKSIAAEDKPFVTKAVVDKVRLISAGEKIIYGFVVSPALYDAQNFINSGDVDKGLALLEEADAQAKQSIERLYIELYRIHALNLYGRMPEAESRIADFEKQEIAFIQSNLMGTVLRADAEAKLGEVDKAIAKYKRVLAQLKGWRFPTSYGGPPTNIAELSWLAEVRSRVTLGLALAEFFKGDYNQAKDWAQQSEQHAADIMGVLTHGLYGPFLGAAHPDIMLAHGVALTLYGSAQIYQAKSLAAGTEAFRTAQISFDKIGFAAGAAYIAVIRTKALLDSDNVDAALTSADEAFALAKAANLHDFIWRVQYLKGLALLKKHDIASAEKAFRDAQIAVDAITGSLGRDSEKRRFGIGKSDISYQLTRLSFNRQAANDLFADLERGRARAFVDMMSDVQSFGGDQQNEIANIRQLDQRSRVQFQRNQMLRAGAPVEQEPEHLISQQRQQAVERINRRNPDLASLLAVSTESMAKVLDSIEKDAIVSYYLPTKRDEKLRRINISQKGTSFDELAVTGAELAKMLKAYRKTIGYVNTPEEARYRQAISDAMRLDKWADANSVYVVPSDTVHYVPWGALDVDKPVMVLPTASWLLSKQANESLATAVIVGDPDFNGELPQLPGAKAEAEYVAKLYKTDALTGNKATETAIRKSVGSGVGLLHLATHAQFNNQQPLQSRLFVAKTGGYEDITVEELFKNPLPAKLVVLSACETGVGEVSTGDDFLGLQRSFYLSGASTVISSLWQVEDKGTALFMQTFHDAISNGANYGESWLAARDAVKAAGMPSWVYGAFIIGGRQ